ncbi:tetratricopeptide repeat protein [Winogradskyella undariae]|uniref:tetratricopeptide repeat protein n=1 Tax=Winogradskyella undariae TaxID=1285465 RepID=UPI00156B7FB6|nr:tetratricopeptide repeat protein [Winogradskyella undariae]NRR89941.1 tetratricopeptide repeat protein [Winogradskyella undariae]
MLKRIFLLLIICCWYSGFSQTNEDQAESYYIKGEFKKALIIYENLVKESPYHYQYNLKLIDIYQQLEQFSDAREIIIKILSQRYNPMTVVVLGYNYQLEGNQLAADKYYGQTIDFIDENPNYINSVAKRFEDYSLLDKAIEVYEKGKRLTPEKNYSLQLARIYGDQGDVELMFSNYIDFIAYSPDHINSIKRAFSDFVSEDSSNDNNIYLRRQLLKKIQQQPKIYWYEMLSWLYVQEKAYKKSFIQEKALYKRSQESFYRIIELASIAHEDNDDETAQTIYKFILESTQNLGALLNAHKSLLEIETNNADDKMILEIDKKYQSLFEEYGKSERTLPLQLAYGKFLAFNLKDTESAIKFLKKSLKLSISKFQQAEVKLLLADILVLQEKFNEALIYYSQIQVNLKNSPLAQEARFKVAKTSYYKGDFDWAESQLNILKSSTSQLIANDALDLKLLISDNKYEDSTQTALKQYAKADLFAFQNKTKEAITLLSQILKEHKGGSITDQTLFQQAKLFEKTKQFDKAESNYLEIIKDYGEGILADDAHYYLAELYNTQLANPEEAKEHYERILFDYQDSIYFIEARRRFRALRGDLLN